MQLVLLALLHVSVCVTSASMCDHNEGPVTRSECGRFRGSWMESRRGRRFQAYRGIRYAEPPVGALRFQPPVPITRYEGEVNATEDGPRAPQPVPDSYEVDEDCLVINVYTPDNNRSRRLPVIVFIHPGGFYSMSGRSNVAGPHYLLDKDLVLVTFNYRLGSLGFLALGNELAPGNNGLKDQVVALRWVQKNIAAFGGDPGLVTIAGCSAGSTSVILHMLSPMSKGLFHRGIALSGSPASFIQTPTHLLDLAKKQGKISKCPTEDLRELYECLKTKTWKEIAGSLLGFFEFGYDPLRLWTPVVEPDFGQERFLPMQPMDAIREGKIHTVPLIISMTENEFFWKAYTVLNNKTLLDTMNEEWDRIAPISFNLPRNNSSVATRRLRNEYFADGPVVNDTRGADQLGDLYAHSITSFNVHRIANLMCRHSSQPVYYSKFSYLGNHSHYEDPITKKPTKVAHHDDLIYLFSLSYRFPLIEVSEHPDSKMVDRMTELWYNFAKFGKPFPQEVSDDKIWPPMTADQRRYLRIDEKLALGENLFENRFQVWEELYPTRY